MTYLLLKLIRFYQLAISPFLGKTCRFYPTCSSYIHEAIEKKGPLNGSWMGLRRLCRCHPWNKGGYDPVEDMTNFKEQ